MAYIYVKSNFDHLRDWMNSRVGRVFEVNELISQFHYAYGTLRKMISHLKTSGFIAKVERGRYRIVKHISTKLTTTELAMMASGKL